MRKGYVYALLSVLTMVMATVLNSIYIHGISNMDAGFINTVTVLLILLIQRVITRKKIVQQKANRSIIAMGVFNLVGLLLMFEAIRLLGASTYGFVSRLSIVFSLFIGIVLLKEQTKVSYWGIALTLVGVVVMQFTKVSSENIYGVMVTALFAFSVSISNAIAKTQSQYSADEKLFYNNVVCIVPLFLYWLISKGSLEGTIPLETILIFMGTSVLSAFLGMKFYFLALKTIDFSTVTMIRTISPVITLWISDVLFKLQPITQRKLVGGIIVLTGMVMVVRKKMEIPKLPSEKID